MMFELSAIDTWFFRDSTPFDKDGAAQAGVPSGFPPHPPTVTGAIRAALARANGWSGRGRWSAELARVLGDGPDDLGALHITGPIVLHGRDPVFAMPRHVVGETTQDGWRPTGWIRDDPRAVRCDLGPETRLPVIDGSSDGELPDASSEHWVSLAGLGQILRGELPDAATIVRADQLWVSEDRVGIERTASSKTVADGALYSTRHVRPCAKTSLGVHVEGVPASWHLPNGQIALGGESRLAMCEPWPAALVLEPPRRASRHVVLIALTPTLLDEREARGLTPIASVGLRVQSGCVARPVRIGGWSFATNAPRTLRNAVPAGSSLFCELHDAERFHRSLTGGLLRVGADTRTGFGLCAVAIAAEETRTT